MSEDADIKNSLLQEDTGLVKAFQANNKASFDKLVLKYKDMVFNVCYRMLGNYEEANDCAEESFVRAFRALKGFRFKSTFKTWIYRIAVNICKNRITSLAYRYGKKMVFIDKPKETEDGDCVVEIADGSPTPLAEIEKKEREALIQSAIDTLSKAHKTIIILRDVENLSYEEIVKITGYNLGTVKSKLARARQKLREKLKGLI